MSDEITRDTLGREGRRGRERPRPPGARSSRARDDALTEDQKAQSEALMARVVSLSFSVLSCSENSESWRRVCVCSAPWNPTLPSNRCSSLTTESATVSVQASRSATQPRNSAPSSPSTVKGFATRTTSVRRGRTSAACLFSGIRYVFAVQVPLSHTFGEQLEAGLNASDPAHRWRVINGGVQGYGPVEEWLFYRDIASRFDPDIVLIVVSVATDAIEAFDAKAKLELGRVPEQTRIQRSRMHVRQIVRSSLVLQLVRLRFDQLHARTFAATFERPLVGYLEQPPSYFFDGLLAAERAFGYVTAQARKNSAKVALVLMPARFQFRDEEYQGLADIGGTRREQAPAPRGHRALRQSTCAGSTSPCSICFRYSRLSRIPRACSSSATLISPRAATALWPGPYWIS